MTKLYSFSSLGNNSKASYSFTVREVLMFYETMLDIQCGL